MKTARHISAFLFLVAALVQSERGTRAWGGFACSEVSCQSASVAYFECTWDETYGSFGYNNSCYGAEIEVYGWQPYVTGMCNEVAWPDRIGIYVYQFECTGGQNSSSGYFACHWEDESCY